MNVFAYGALLGWIPLTYLVFYVAPPRRAVMFSFLGGWLFLPVAGISLPGFPDYTKVSAISAATLMAALTRDGARVYACKARWFDLPIVVWCLWPLVSAIAAGLGPRAGISAVLEQVLRWGIPYLLGRAYFRDSDALKELLLSVCAAGLIYIPFCLYEIRLSPNLHYYVYGFAQHEFLQTRRFGGWRPHVFMEHGLAVGLFMVTASLAAISLWASRQRDRVLHLGLGTCSGALLLTTVACKSLGSLVLLGGALVSLILTRNGKRAWIVALFLLTPGVVMAGRLTGTIETGPIMEWVEQYVPMSRADSLRARMETEDTLMQRAGARPITGWGPWGDYRVGDGGEDLVHATDGLWIIVLGKYGLVGLASFVMMFLVPALLALRSGAGRTSLPGSRGFVRTPCLLIGLFLMDSLFNGLPNPLYALVAGALASAHDALGQGPTAYPRQLSRMPALSAWGVAY